MGKIGYYCLKIQTSCNFGFYCQDSKTTDSFLTHGHCGHVPMALRLGAPKRPKEAVAKPGDPFLRSEKARARSNEAQARLEGPLPGLKGPLTCQRGSKPDSNIAVSYHWGSYWHKGGPLCQREAQHDQNRGHLVKETPTYNCALGPVLAYATKGPDSSGILQS